MKKIFSLAFVLLVLFSASSPAKDEKAKESDLIRMCLKGSTEQQVNHIAVNCVGKMADKCLANDKNSDTAAMANCYREEGLVWNSVLNENYRKLKAQLTKEQYEVLTNYQRDWIKLLQSKCFLTNQLYEGSISKIIAAQCSQNELARRAIELHVLTKELPAK